MLRIDALQARTAADRNRQKWRTGEQVRSSCQEVVARLSARPFSVY